MDHIRGLSRNKLALFPEALDDYISQENPVRSIDASQPLVEIVFSILSYNIKRAIKILGVQRMIEALA